MRTAIYELCILPSGIQGRGVLLDYKCHTFTAKLGVGRTIRMWRTNKVNMVYPLNRRLWKILGIGGIQWMDEVGNRDLWERTNQVQIEINILKRSSYLEKAKQQHYKTGLDMEPSRQEKAGAELATTGEEVCHSLIILLYCYVRNKRNYCWK